MLCAHVLTRCSRLRGATSGATESQTKGLVSQDQARLDRGTVSFFDVVTSSCDVSSCDVVKGLNNASRPIVGSDKSCDNQLAG
jgi:hypothetical protein